MDCFQKSSRIEFDGLGFATFWNWSVLGWSIFRVPNFDTVKTWCQSLAHNSESKKNDSNCSTDTDKMHGTLDVSNLAQESDACFRFWIPTIFPCSTQKYGPTLATARPRMVHGGVGFALRHQGTSSGFLPSLVKLQPLQQNFYSYLWFFHFRAWTLCKRMVCKRHLQMFWLFFSILLIICRFHLAATGKPAPLPQDPQTKPLRWTLSHLQCR